MNRLMKRITLATFDLAILYLTGLFSYLFLDPFLGLESEPMIWSLVIGTGVYIGLSFYFRLFDKVNLYTSIKETLVHALIVTVAFTIKRMEEVKLEMLDYFEMVIFDMPPLLAVTDAQVMAFKTDGVLFVIPKGQASKDEVIKAKDLLDKVKADVLGAVLNRVDKLDE